MHNVDVSAGIGAALEDLAAGRMVVVAEDKTGGEGHLVVAAQMADAEALTYLFRRARGNWLLALTGERCDELGLALMVPARAGAVPGRPQPLAATLSVDARAGIGNGVSVHDRAQTIATLMHPGCGSEDLISPGHVFPVRTRTGGVLELPSHAEAAVDLLRLAELTPAAVTCPILGDDGSPIRGAALTQFCAQHDLELVAVTDLVRHRRARAQSVERAAEAMLPTRFGHFHAVGYRTRVDGAEHLALVKGDIAGRSDVPVLLHTRCLAGDVFGSSLCGCAQRLRTALTRIESEGAGVIVYVADSDHEVGICPVYSDVLRPVADPTDAPASVATDALVSTSDEELTAVAILTDLDVRSVRVLGSELSERRPASESALATPVREALA